MKQVQKDRGRDKRREEGEIEPMAECKDGQQKAENKRREAAAREKRGKSRKTNGRHISAGLFACDWTDGLDGQKSKK